MQSISKTNLTAHFLVFCIFFSYLLLTRFLIQSKNFSFIESLTKPRFDTLEYRKVADYGYSAAVTVVESKVVYSGNVVWFPLYPIILKGLGIIPVFSLDVKTFLLSLVLTLLFCLLLYSLVSSKFGRSKGLLSVVGILAFPTSFYLLIGFPYSLLLTLVLLYLNLLRNGRTSLARIVSMAVSLAYPSGLFLAVIPVTRNFLARKSISEFIKRSSVDAAFFVSPVVFLFLYYYIKFGDFWIFFKVQASGFGRSFSGPFNFLKLIPDALGTKESNRPEVLMLVFLVLNALLFTSKKFGVEFILYSLSVIALSLSTGTLTSVYRHYVILFPLAIWFAVSNRSLTVKLAYIIISILLLNWYLVFYISGNLV